MKIGPINYKVEEVERLGVNIGEIESSTATILVLAGIDTQVYYATLLHECVHAILYQARLDHDEVITEVLANGILSLLLDNKDFFLELLAFGETK